MGQMTAPSGVELPVHHARDWRKPLRVAWRALRVLVQVNGVVQLVQNGESPVAQWAHEALGILLDVIHMLPGR
jgi:hypothetical protein